ncbi:MAG: uracil-DNA glycosylase family protein [Caldilinea sp.]|nr:uracil-DNA glycosylase family protein [Caldilinea sp.]MCB0148055.1 uracil-DNA glycosylase family protein [Caldilineaceae bacterium]MCB9122324.1 uracil-DNA glycosylase family protein [Caldilineaceae bacterium]MCB9124712.1 uracil-DNA glycosylase family protein [Caldilineaceae bacterium]MCO5209878.1 uracil-DNA glycosylase family protein [Caldilinea sp.]
MLRPSECVGCRTFPCTDVEHSRYTVPDIAIDPATVRIILISEAAPAAPADGYYTGAGSLFAQTTVEAFQDAGAAVRTSDDVLGLGVYLTTAVKCGKTGYAIATPTVHECSMILAEELALFPNVRALLLMGDVAIKAINAIAKRAGEPRVIPAGATYKLRGGVYSFRGMRAFPSYLQAGPSFYIEKSKRKAIAEDIAAALALTG